MTSSSVPGSGEPAATDDANVGDETFVEPSVPMPKPQRDKAGPPKQDKTTMILLLLAAFVAVGGVGFAVGHMTGGSATGNASATSARGGFGRAGASLAPGQTFDVGALAGRGGVSGLTGGVSGTVQSIDGTTMVIQLASGTSVTIDLTGSTTYHGTTAATSGDVKVGSSVTVQIAANASAATTPAPGSSGGRNLSAQDVIITNP
ncbi:MAG TPA: hypothetical protein VF337_02795 [Candidatus Limnocylindrales bacterium]